MPIERSSLMDWSRFCLDLAEEAPIFTHSIRKIVPDIMFQTTLDQSIKLTNTGFKESGSKLTMLKKYYYNAESIEKAKVALDKIRKKGDFGSVAFSTIGQEKKFTHHQHCIQSVAIRHHPDGELGYTVFYRAAEVIKIFTGDMVFVRDVLMPQFGSGRVCFVFSNAVLNAMYTPIMFIHDKNRWIDHLHIIKRVDEAYHKRMKKWCQMYFSDEPINYSSAEVIRGHIHAHIKASERKAILKEFK